MDIFKATYEASTSLLPRFDLVPGIAGAKEKLQQEVVELIIAADGLLQLEDTIREDIRYNSQMEVAEEIADVIITAINLGKAAGLAEHNLRIALLKKNEKNNLKTPLTHEVVIWPNGAMTIERIGRYPDLPKWKHDEQPQHA